MQHPDTRQEFLVIDYKGQPGVLAKRDFDPDVHTLYVAPAPVAPPGPLVVPVAPVDAAPKKAAK